MNNLPTNLDLKFQQRFETAILAETKTTTCRLKSNKWHPGYFANLKIVHNDATEEYIAYAKIKHVFPLTDFIKTPADREKIAKQDGFNNYNEFIAFVEMINHKKFDANEYNIIFFVILERYKRKQTSLFA